MTTPREPLLEPARTVPALSPDRLQNPQALVPLSVLPRTAPQDPPLVVEVVIADLSVAGRYVPAGDGPEPIAGDFYDVLQIGPDRLVLALGDVSGHGPPALARMQALRAATRAAAAEHLRPRQALAALEALYDTQPDEGLATIW